MRSRASVLSALCVLGLGAVVQEARAWDCGPYTPVGQKSWGDGQVSCDALLARLAVLDPYKVVPASIPLINANGTCEKRHVMIAYGQDHGLPQALPPSSSVHVVGVGSIGGLYTDENKPSTDLTQPPYTFAAQTTVPNFFYMNGGNMDLFALNPDININTAEYRGFWPSQGDYINHTFLAPGSQSTGSFSGGNLQAPANGYWSCYGQTGGTGAFSQVACNSKTATAVVGNPQGCVQRDYILYRPVNSSASAALPLWVHMQGSTANEFEYLGLMGLQPLADQKQFYLALPETEMTPSGNYHSGLIANLIPNEWSTAGNVPGQPMRNLDMIFFQELVTDIESLVAVKQSKVYMSGHSGGADFAEAAMADPTITGLVAAGFFMAALPLSATQLQALNSVPRNYAVDNLGLPKPQSITALTPAFDYGALVHPKPVAFYAAGNDQFIAWDAPDGSAPVAQESSLAGDCLPNSPTNYPFFEKDTPYYYGFLNQEGCQQSRSTHQGSRDRIVSQLGCSTSAGQPMWAPFDPDNKFSYVYNKGCKGGAQVLTITGTVGSGNPKPAAGQNWAGGRGGQQGIQGQTHLENASANSLGPVYCSFLQGAPTFDPAPAQMAPPVANASPSPQWHSPLGPDYLLAGFDTLSNNQVDGSKTVSLDPGCGTEYPGGLFTGNYTYQFKLPPASGPLYPSGYFDINALVWEFFDQFGN